MAYDRYSELRQGPRHREDDIVDWLDGQVTQRQWMFGADGFHQTPPTGNNNIQSTLLQSKKNRGIQKVVLLFKEHNLEKVVVLRR